MLAVTSLINYCGFTAYCKDQSNRNYYHIGCGFYNLKIDPKFATTKNSREVLVNRKNLLKYVNAGYDETFDKLMKEQFSLNIDWKYYHDHLECGAGEELEAKVDL